MLKIFYKTIIIFLLLLKFEQTDSAIPDLYNIICVVLL